MIFVRGFSSKLESYVYTCGSMVSQEKKKAGISNDTSWAILLVI